MSMKPIRGKNPGAIEAIQAIAEGEKPTTYKAFPARLQLNIHPEMLHAIALECAITNPRNNGKQLQITDIAIEFWQLWLESRGVEVPANWAKKPKEWTTDNYDFSVDKKEAEKAAKK